MQNPHKRTLYFAQRLILLIIGALTTLSYAPFNLHLLPPFTFAFMFWYLYHAQSKRMAMGSVFYFCLGLFGTGVHWVYISPYYFGNTPLVTSILANAILVLYLTAVMTVAGLLIYTARHLRGTLWMLYAASVWFLCEWFRAWFMKGFPWLAPGFSQTDGLLAGFFPLIGTNATGFVLILCAIAVMFGLLNRYRLWLAMPILFFLVGYLLKPIEWTSPVGETKQITLVQGNIDQNQKWNANSFNRQWEDYIETTANSLVNPADLIIWPETAMPIIYNNNPDIRTAQNDLALEFDVPLIFGTFWAVDGQQPGNALVHAPPNGDYMQESVYLKSHLLPFGEEIPYERILRPLYEAISNIPISSMAKGGPTQPLFQIDEDFAVAPFICFESAFGNELIDTTSQANLLVNVSNDAWFRNSIALDQHFQINRARAIESRKWLARVTNTGMTALVNPFGVATQQLDVTYLPEDMGRGTSMTGSIQPREGMTPYQWVGDWPWRIFSLLMLAFGLIFGRPPRVKPSNVL